MQQGNAEVSVTVSQNKETQTQKQKHLVLFSAFDDTKRSLNQGGQGIPCNLMRNESITVYTCITLRR